VKETRLLIAEVPSIIGFLRTQLN